MSVGSYNGSIFILGGGSSYYSMQYASGVFDVLETAETLYNIQGTGDYYTQIDDSLYMIDASRSYLNKYNMNTKKSFTLKEFKEIEINVGMTGCLTSTDDFIFVLGGNSGTNVQILDLKTMNWLNNIPSMQIQRYDHSCIVDPITSSLWAIGGQNDETYLNSIETINIINIMEQESQWHYITDTLFEPIIYVRSILVFNRIYVIGGYSNDGNVDTVQVIDPLFETVSILPDRLPTSISLISITTINNVIYVFSDNRYWMTYEIPISSTVTSPSYSLTAVVIASITVGILCLILLISGSVLIYLKMYRFGIDVFRRSIFNNDLHTNNDTNNSINELQNIDINELQNNSINKLPKQSTMSLLPSLPDMKTMTNTKPEGKLSDIIEMENEYEYTEELIYDHNEYVSNVIEKENSTTMTDGMYENAPQTNDELTTLGNTNIKDNNDQNEGI
eukprot:14536_1